ncbi:MAG: hypothetical protein GXP62_17240 [Oligoflexia bacterium]|nr:hypothetical protein [Oligoflexia bacterium]
MAAVFAGFDVPRAHRGARCRGLRCAPGSGPDPRFPPVDAGDLDDLEIEVSVLDILLLPALVGLDTVSTQLSAVRRKAGIGAQEPIHIQRFTVHKDAAP